MSVSKSKEFGTCSCGYSKCFSGRGMGLCLGHNPVYPCGECQGDGEGGGVLTFFLSVY